MAMLLPDGELTTHGCAEGTVTLDCAVAEVAEYTPVAVAVFARPPTASPVVVVWTAVQVVVAPGASGVVGQEMPTAFGSLTVTTVMVTLPALVTLKL